MSHFLMFLRRRVLQFVAGTAMLIFYIQFQLLSYTDKRLLLKKIALVLPRLPGGSTEARDNLCSYKTLSKTADGLTLLSWRSTYITDLQSFKDFPLFPRHPASVQFNMKTSLRLPLPISTGGWLFGLLYVPQSGEYRFALSTNGEAELRLSRNAEPEKTRVIASLKSSGKQPKPGEYNKHSSQTSVSLSLLKCKAYYLEVFFHTSSKDSHVDLAWETPNSLSYEIISTNYLTPYITAEDFAYSGNNLLIFEDNIKMSSLFRYVFRQKHSVENEDLDQWSRLPYMLSNHARNLPQCSENFKGYAPSPRLIIPKINSKSTEKFIRNYIGRLTKASNGKYSFRGINYAEEKSLDDKGTRYLMNIEFQDNIMETRTRVSEYLFYENQKSDLCFVHDFTWKRDAMVTIVALILDMNTWSHYFLDHLSAMTSKLQDARFSVIIVAARGLKQYFQTIIDENSLTWHSHVTLLLMSAKETQNNKHIIKACLARITTHNTILFFTDIRVQLPLNVLEQVRKQTIEGRTIYMPWPENFDEGYKNNVTVINPLERTKAKRPPSFAVYVSDMKILTGQKSYVNKPRKAAAPAWKKSWWDDLVNGALEVYASKMPKFFYFQQE